ncbi:MAG: hypothetical protein FWF56_05245 [Firmicutes bacterium]|nr:hypothetical protein [Bacillota bacterium]MCL1953814.1 hypothetical protein [Bacillota bacterium]
MEIDNLQKIKQLAYKIFVLERENYTTGELSKGEIVNKIIKLIKEQARNDIK